MYDPPKDFSNKKMGKERIKIGKIGEDMAARFLTRLGWQLLNRNYRTRWGEIDVVAKDKDCYVFVEVKTSRFSFSILPQESVTQRKQLKISKMALSYLKRFSLVGTKARFDVIAVWLSPKSSLCLKIELIKNAFPLPLIFSP